MTLELERQGLGGIEHHPPIDKADLEKLYSSFDVRNPESLQSKVFVNIMLHFGSHGRGNPQNLNRTDFATTTDAKGWRYIYPNKDELTKNHQTDTNTAQGRMYEIKEDDNRCPVKSFVRYVKMLPPRCPYLFPKVRRTPNKSGHYFDNVPIGHNKLGGLMTSLSTKYDLSRKYTNHSLRATSIHLLDSAQVPSQHIMTVTGHKSEQSFKTYTGFTDVNTKRHMSHTISRGIGLNVDKPVMKMEKGVTGVVEAENMNFDIPDLGDFDLVNSVLQPLSNSQMNTLLGDFDADEFNYIAASLVLDSDQLHVKPNVNTVPSQTNVKNNVSHVLNYSGFPISQFQAPFITG